MKKILFFIRSLDAGGAERQLVLTAKALDEIGYNVTVLTFYEGGFYANEFSNSNISLLSLQKKGRWDVIGFLFRLRGALCKQSPDVIYSFLGVANILSVIIRPFIPVTRLVWGVRASNMNLDKYDWLSRWSYWIECKLSRFPDIIIANSNAGANYATEHGFPKNKIKVIPNGINTNHFQFCKSAGKSIRKHWKIAEDEYLIGLVGRVDPMKGHVTFLEAAAKYKQKNKKARFICVGEAESVYANSMRELATKLGLDDVLTWAGRHDDMVAVYSALDIFTSSSSYGEGFPNVLGEAMACEVPCVVTNVGDSAIVVGTTGIVIPAKDKQAMVIAWDNLFMLNDEDRRERKIATRNRVINKFSVAKMISSTEAVLKGKR